MLSSDYEDLEYGFYFQISENHAVLIVKSKTVYEQNTAIASYLTHLLKKNEFSRLGYVKKKIKKTHTHTTTKHLFSTGQYII